MIQPVFLPKVFMLLNSADEFYSDFNTDEYDMFLLNYSSFRSLMIGTQFSFTLRYDVFSDAQLLHFLV